MADHEASFAGPESHDAERALSRAPGSLRTTPVVVAICVLGLFLTALAAWTVARVDRNTEQRLLQGQTRQAATVLSTAIMGIQQPLAATLDALSFVPLSRDSGMFPRLFDREVGADRPFTSASLWHRDAKGFTRVASLGRGTQAVSAGAETDAFFVRALSAETFAVRRVDLGQRTLIGYAKADPETGRVVYAERAIPSDRRAPVAEDSAFADLHYAIYFGKSTRTSDLTTTDVDPADLPLEGVTYETEIPFGDTTLTMAMSPRDHLGSDLGRWLPWMLLLSGSFLTVIAALVALKLVRSRARAEGDTETITTLYQRVDTLYGEQRDLFVRLQRALLPQASPDIPGIEFGSQYVAGAQGIDIGGDWYSVIGTGGGRFAFVVGDVSGNGIDAVAEMARARFTLRAYLLEGHDPGDALERCSAQFDVATDGHIITALVGVGDRDTGEITVANAGHPAPLLASSNGSEFVHLPVGWPLGVGHTTYESSTFIMPPGSTLVCYTDGLIERRGESIDVGMQRLAERVACVVQQPLESLISAVIESMRDSASTDDIAILALRRLESRTLLAADAEAPAVARAYVRERLQGKQLPGGAKVEDVVLAASELVTNSFRAGANHVYIELNVTTDRLELAVEDDAVGWPQKSAAPPDAIRGRGLSIVDQLSDSLVVTHAGSGKRVSVGWLASVAAEP